MGREHSAITDRWRRSLRWLLNLSLLLILVVVWTPLPRPLFKKDFSLLVLDKNGDILRAFLNDDDQWHFPPDQQQPLPAKLKTAALCFEDRFFYYHPGINPVSLFRALFRNLSAGEVHSGASTITMQVIRLASPRERTIANKLVEMLQAFKLEILYSKERILRWYLDHAPYGGNVVGYRAASHRFFNKRPDQLSWGEAATLAVLPNSPGLISPMMNRDLLIKKRNRLLDRLLKQERINTDIHRDSSKEPLPTDHASFFQLAPHLAQSLRERRNITSGVLKTTIDRRFQADIERMTGYHLEILGRQGIHNGALMVAETSSGRIRAYIGSNNFFDFVHGGQNDGVRAPRSTGSILKPFLYALAMDDGIVYPQTVIRDVPTYFGSFSPSNATRTYDGIVRADQALIRSLNVPATRVLNAYGVNRFYRFLATGGMSTLYRPPDQYGLTLILGGAETTVYDLTRLYRGLGNGGVFSPLTLVAGSSPVPADSSVSLISREACHLVLNILRRLSRPGAEHYWHQYRNQYPIAWKTGTSYGQRDAWSVGVTPEWTIAVWVGNFSGEGTPNLSGAECAAPLMFDVFNYLPKNPRNSWFQKDSLRFRRAVLCRETGLAVSPSCPHPLETRVPRTRRPLRHCPFHKTIYTTRDGAYQVCSLCWKTGRHTTRRALLYPPDVVQFLRKTGVIIERIPPHKPDCPAISGRDSLQILYPVKNAHVWIPRDFNGRPQRITLRAAHQIPDTRIFWYLDRIYSGETQQTHKLAVSLTAGWHRLEIVDETGNRVRRDFFVAAGGESP